MLVPSDQVETKKKIGKANGKDLWYYKLRGGLHMVVDSRGMPIGTGSHRAVARHVAKKFEPDAVWTELSKADHYDVKDFEHLLPEWEQYTAELREIWGKK